MPNTVMLMQNRAQLSMGGKGLKRPSAKVSKTIIQLVKEFCVPFLVALIWTVAVLWGKPMDPQTIGSNFASVFFFTSWMTGQVFRVRKQAGVESSLSLLESRVSHVVGQLEAQTLELTNHMDGGDSFCAFNICLQEENQSYWLAVTHGKYPMYNVSARVIDLDLYDETSRRPQVEDAETYIEIGDLSLDGAHISKLFDLGDSSSRRFNVFFAAKNRSVVQNIKYKLVDGEWTWATKVFDETGELARLDHNFPPDDLGNIWPVNADDGLSSPSYLGSFRWP